MIDAFHMRSRQVRYSYQQLSDVAAICFDRGITAAIVADVRRLVIGLNAIVLTASPELIHVTD